MEPFQATSYALTEKGGDATGVHVSPVEEYAMLDVPATPHAMNSPLP